MLEFFISSAAKRKTLIYLLKNQEREYHLRELSRNIGEPASVIKRGLDRLEQIGFVISWTAGNRKRFKVNRNFLLLPELESLIDKSTSIPASPRIANTFNLQETLSKRKAWEKRSKEIVKEYGESLKRQRPRHPAETRMLEKIS